MKGSRMYLLMLLAVVVMVGLSPTAFAQSTAPGKSIELRLAHMMPVASPSHQHIEAWAKKIATDSKGRLTIRIFASNTLLPGPELYDGVVKGAADIGFSWRYKPEGYGIGVTFPFIVGAPDIATASRVYDDLWQKFPKAMGEEWKGVKVLYRVPSVPNHVASRKTLRKVEDLKGQQMRVPSREAAAFLKDLGASPVFMSTADMVIGVEKGTVDGSFLLSSTIVDYKMGGKIKYIIMDPIGFAGPVFLGVNWDAYNKLPADLKAVLDNSSEWAKNDALNYWTATLEDAKKYFKTDGVEMIYLSGAEKEKLTAAYNGTCDKIGAELDGKGLPGTEVVRFIRERVKHYAR
jgi:TRAP-type transport system periplasmic protein